MILCCKQQVAICNIIQVVAVMQCRMCHSQQDLLCSQCSHKHYTLIQQQIATMQPSLQKQKISYESRFGKPIHLHPEKDQPKNSEGLKSTMLEEEIANDKVCFAKMKRIIQYNRKWAKMRQIQMLNKRIQQLQQKKQEYKQHYQRLVQIAKQNKQNQHFLQNAQHQVRQTVLQNLVNSNQKLVASVQKQRLNKLATIHKILKFCKMDENKYKIQRYFRITADKNVIFTINSSTNKNLGDIPVIKAYSQQIVSYFELQKQGGSGSSQGKYEYQKEDKEQQQKQLNQMITQMLMTSYKVFVLTHKIFFSDVKLPYGYYTSKTARCLYIGNIYLKLDGPNGVNFHAESVIHFINLFQANLQYLAYALGTNQRPFLIFSTPFYQQLYRKKFIKMGFRETAQQQKQNKQGKQRIQSKKSVINQEEQQTLVIQNKKKVESRKWHSFLKYLKVHDIILHYQIEHQEEYYQNEIISQSGLIILQRVHSGSNRDPDAKSIRSSRSDDDHFQILE